MENLSKISARKFLKIAFNKALNNDAKKWRVLAQRYLAGELGESKNYVLILQS